MSEYLRAFIRYLRQPKTVFDLQDRFKAIVLLAVIIVLLQRLYKWLILN